MTPEEKEKLIEEMADNLPAYLDFQYRRKIANTFLSALDKHGGYAPEGLLEPRPIEDAPRDGTAFLTIDLDHPDRGLDYTARRVRDELNSEGYMETKDLGGWLYVGDIEPDYDTGETNTGDFNVAIAMDKHNKSVRRGFILLDDVLRAMRDAHRKG